MKINVFMRLRNEYQGKTYADLEKLTNEIFKDLDETVKEYGSFKSVKRKYDSKWDSAKGELSYTYIENDEDQVGLKIRFSAEYPALKFDFRNGYVEANISLSSNRNHFDGKILDKLRAKFNSFEEEGRYEIWEFQKKKIKLIKKFRNDYPGNYRSSLEKSSKEIFDALEDLLEKREDSKFIQKDYKGRCIFGDWNVAKGELIYKIIEEGNIRSDLKIKFQVAYPWFCQDFEKGYVQIKVKASTTKGRTFDENIFDEIEEKFNSFREEKKEK